MSEVKNIPDGWVKTTLGENLTEIAMGPFGSNLKVDMFTENGVPIIKGGNLSGYFVEGDFSFVSEEKATSLRKAIAYPNDLIITHRGTLGQVSLVPEGKYKRYVTSQSQLRLAVNPDKIYYRYLLYFFKSRIGQFELLKNSSQVGVPAISTPTKSVKEIDLVIPSDVKEQKSIASILSALDDKIELLQAQNKTLEETAQTIFAEWFGKYSVDDELPQGWRVSKLMNLDFISFGDGNYSSKYPKQSEFIEKGVPFISNKDIKNGIIQDNGLRYISQELHSTLKKGHLQKWDIIMSTRANIGDMALVSDNFSGANINAQLVFIRTDNKELYTPYLFQLFSSDLYKKILDNYSSGSAQSQLPMHALKEIKVIMPNDSILKKYSDLWIKLISKKENNQIQIQLLTKTRAELLPRLMSGEVRVNEFKV